VQIGEYNVVYDCGPGVSTGNAKSASVSITICVFTHIFSIFRLWVIGPQEDVMTCSK